jgi:predicted DNA-binding transcriptional regulator YafY
VNRIDRLMGIMTVLQSKKFLPAEKLAEKFDISIRTVYRDIKALNEIGVPVLFEPLKGYCIAKGFFLPPLSFTIEEANALILLQTLSHRFTDQSIATHSNTALNKIKAVLRYYDKDKAEQSSSQTNIFVPLNEQSNNAYLSTIQTAISEKHILKIGYTDGKSKNTSREIEPVGLIFYTYQWHLIAWCWLRNDYRDFKTTMISNLANTQTPFRKEHNFDPADYIKLF